MTVMETLLPIMNILTEPNSLILPLKNKLLQKKAQQYY